MAHERRVAAGDGDPVADGRLVRRDRSFRFAERQ
jgi:hypothetical protein